MSATLYPSVVKQWNAYFTSGRAIGAVDFTSPKITFEKSDLNGAGISGKMSLPISGNVSPMECTIGFHTPTDQVLNAFTGQGQQLRVLSSIQFNDTSSGSFKEQPEEFVLTVYNGAFDPGKRDSTSKAVTTLTFDVTFLQYYLNGHLIIEIDQMNDICIINRTDLNTVTRQNTGA
jgi:P2 family phage contractile tail tube protein